jgi:hypothetical protein
VPGKQLLLEVSEINIYSDNFSTSTKSAASREHSFNYSKPKHYKGKVKHSPGSTVSLNWHDGKLSGVIRHGHQTYNLAYSTMLERHIIFDHQDTEEDFTFTCEQLMDEDYSEHIVQEFRKSSSNCQEAVNVYFECDYQMYQNFGYDSTAVVDYVVDLFTEVNLLYANENLPILISQVVVWTSPDPYTQGAFGIFDFQAELNNSGFNGDLAHLLTNDNGANGGLAYVDELCGNSPFAYSDLVNSHDLYPAYSWDVQVVAHELGHNFGSRHTHECVWGPNGNEQIDDCGNVYNGTGGICYDPNNPIIPSEGGTVMSYCHLDPVGIDLMNGFGLQPGSLMRDKHDDCFCDNSSCLSATTLTNGGTYSAEPEDGNGASLPTATHADWFIFSADTDGTISIASCGQMVDTRLWIWEGSCDQLNFVAASDDDCDIGNGSNYASLLDSIPVNAGQHYYIEWDDRWSNAAFSWSFNYIPDDGQTNDCDGDIIVVSGNISDTLLHAKTMIECDAMLMNDAEVMFKAGNSLEFLPGFEISQGVKFETIIEDCDND